MTLNGWCQLAFERELTAPLTAAEAGGRKLAIAKAASGVRIIDATCPHRGAHLAYGGVLEDNAVVCPFHGYRIDLGESGASELCVREYPALTVGGLVFVNLSASHDRGFRETVEALDRECFFVPGFSIKVAADWRLIVENGFDSAHFAPVHGIRNQPDFALERREGGPLTIRGMLEVPASPWMKEAALVQFTVDAFHPGIVISGLGGPKPYSAITCATPRADGSTTVRFSLILPAPPSGAAPSPDWCRYLLDQSRRGLEKDREIWENLQPLDAPRWMPRDAAVLEFRRFCEEFEQEEQPPCERDYFCLAAQETGA